MKNKVLILFISFFYKNLFAIENIGFCYEYLNERVYEIVPGYKVKLTEDQLLVRGELEAHHEQGYEGSIYWAVFEKDRYKLYPSADNALFGIDQGDYIFILDPNTHQILIKGYFFELIITEKVDWLGNELELSSNRPHLFLDFSQKTLILDHPFLGALFTKKLKAILIKNKRPELLDLEMYRSVIQKNERL